MARLSTPRDRRYDWLVIGSGFGGSVAAYRLAQKGYRVGVLEMGRRFAPDQFPRTNWDVKNYLWLPRLGCHGILKMNPLRDLTVLSGTGVGGGSLVYGNTLFTPKAPFFAHPLVQDMGGDAGLAPFYATARRMLGVVDNPRLFEPDRLLRETAEEYGRGHTFHRSPVGIFFGEPEVTVPDPYFDGAGPARTGCRFCGGCFLGCRHGAKNSLDKNYLYLAEQLGAHVLPERRVVELSPLGRGGASGYRIAARPSTHRGETETFEARGVVVAAGVLGTLELLLTMRDNRVLPRLSERLGHDVRSNGETIIGVKSRDPDVDYSRGIAASSSVFPDEHTHIQADRYPAGADAMGVMATLLTDGGGMMPRPLRLLANIAKRPRDFAVIANPLGFAKRTIILVVMQDTDSSLRIVRKRSMLSPLRPGLASVRGDGEGVPTYIPLGNKFAQRLAKRMNGVAGNTTVEVLFNTPMSAHILGGCIIGHSPTGGVVDLQSRAFGYENLIVSDGSTIPVNLGVNPALSITALTERAMSFVPEN